MSGFHFIAPLNKKEIDANAIAKINDVEAFMESIDLVSFELLNVSVIHEEIILTAFHEYESETIWPMMLQLAQAAPIYVREGDPVEGETLLTEQQVLEAIDGEHDFEQPSHGLLNCDHDLEGKFEPHQFEPMFYEKYDVVFTVYDTRLAMMLKLNGLTEVKNYKPRRLH